MQAEDSAEVDRQLPEHGEIFLDHVGHFVRDAAAAAAALERAGFAPTPVSVQADPDGTPTGTGNVTAMLRRGYVEVLFKTADTVLGREFDAALSRYCGVHLAALAVADAAAAHGRLAAAGFPMRPLVQMLQRPVETVRGPDTAAFTVVRAERGAMPEGRIQILNHCTEHTVWQERWLDHPNGARALIDLVVVSPEVEEAAARLARFADRPATATRHGRSLRLDRGRIEIVGPKAFAALVPNADIPDLPFIGAYAVEVAALDRAAALLQSRCAGTRCIGKAVQAPFPPALGLGTWVFVEDRADLPWRE